MRLRTDVWVAAYRARLEAEGIHAHIVAKGDASAGDVLVKLAFMNDVASLFSRAPATFGPPAWVAEIEGRAEAEVDALVARRRARDRDLWVIEVEDPRGRHLLDAPGIADTLGAGWP
ncbi:MAG: DUF1491 family protein [Paracoccaceae bacterium]